MPWLTITLRNQNCLPWTTGHFNQATSFKSANSLPTVSTLKSSTNGLDTLQLSRLSNARIYLHPYTLGAWGLTLALLVQFSGMLNAGWPIILLIMLTMTSGFLITGEFITRNRFEAKATEIIDSDLRLNDIPKYFGKDRFVVATLGGREIIGCCGLQIDGRVGIVRHWHVKFRYRGRGLGWDLLESVIEKGQEATKKNPLEKIECDTYNLQTRAEKTLKDHGFGRVGGDTVEPGLLGWYGIRTRTWIKELK